MLKANLLKLAKRAERKSRRPLFAGPQPKFLAFLFIWLCAAATPLAAQSQARATAERRTAQYFESIRERPPELQAFLRQMPKGGDLHNHLSGAIYAETYVQWAAQAGLCVDQKTLALSGGQCDEAAGRPPASKALTDGVLYRRMVDAWSMRNWEYSGQSGHDQFFDAFGKFGAAVVGRFGEMLAEVTARAAAGRVSYLELMLTPDNGRSRFIAIQLAWQDDFEKMRAELLKQGISQAVEEGRSTLNQAEAKKRELLRCGTPQADAGCQVAVRYIFQVGRAAPPKDVFAQMVAAFEMAGADPRLVALNLVQPEDSLSSMSNFSLHMRMLDYLHSVYPKVHITLHAGELAPGSVPPEGLRFHIRESVEKGHAERIGHGVDIMSEDDALGLLREMAERKVMVEICLSSNDGILGVRGKQHPLATYLKYHVPVALATDDEGVARSEMTREYLKAAEEQGLGYLQLKTMARTSLEHAFISGASLWKDAQRFVPAPACALERSSRNNLSPRCRQFLDSSEKARLQWELEAAFKEFEKNY